MDGEEEGRDGKRRNEVRTREGDKESFNKERKAARHENSTTNNKTRQGKAKER